MSLLRKLCILAGALVRQPFMPREQKEELDEGAKAPIDQGTPREQLALSGQEPDPADGERVADLIAKAQRE